MPGVNARLHGAKDGHDAVWLSRRAVPAPGTATPPPPVVDGGSRRRLWEQCWRGTAPAELLDAEEREQLVAWFWSCGWVDAEIAAHTRMTTYTTCRIRQRLGLPAIRHETGVA